MNNTFGNTKDIRKRNQRDIMLGISFVIFALLLLAAISVSAQVKIGDNPNTINANSLLELESTNKGFLPPRMALNSLSTVAPLTGTVPSGMLIYSSGGTLKDGYYYWNGSKWISIPAQRDNFVLVKSAADFPAAVGGVITLAAGTLYEINGTITLTDKIDLNSCTIEGRDRFNDKLLYTPTSGELFTGTNGGNIIDLTLSATGVGSMLFNLDVAGSLVKSLLVESVFVLNCDNIGLIKGVGGFVEFQSCGFSNNMNGVTLQDIGDYIGINNYWVADNHNTYETFVGTFGTIHMTGGKKQVLSAFSAKGLDITGITSITNAAALKTGLYLGDGTYLVGSFSNKWEAESYGLNTEKDDVASGNIYLSTSATTTFTAVNTPVKVKGTTTAASLFRLSNPANNKLTYSGAKTRRFMVLCSSTLSSTANNKYFSLYVSKNGVALPESKQSIKLANNTDQNSFAISCTVQLAPGDYIEMWVENNSDNSSVTVNSMNLAIK